MGKQSDVFRDGEQEELRKDALARNDARGIRIMDELEEMLRLCRFQREALKNECTDGFGYKQLAADLKTVQKTEKLALAYTRLTDAQIKLNKHLKDIADVMTPEEEKSAVRKYIQAMSQMDRGVFISDLIKWHNDRSEHGKLRTLEQDLERREDRANGVHATREQRKYDKASNSSPTGTKEKKDAE